MATAFQSNAFQNNAFQIEIPIPPLPGILPTRLPAFRPIIIDGRIDEKQTGNEENIIGILIISGMINSYQNIFINKIDLYFKSKYEKDLEEILILVELDD